MILTCLKIRGISSPTEITNWRTIKDFRNVLSHEYFGIDNKIVWQLITEKLAPLKNQIGLMLRSLE